MKGMQAAWQGSVHCCLAGQSRLQVGPACRFMLTTTLHWNLQWSILDHLFDKDFHVCPAFLADVPALQRRLRRALSARPWCV